MKLFDHEKWIYGKIVEDYEQHYFKGRTRLERETDHYRAGNKERLNI